MISQKLLSFPSMLPVLKSQPSSHVPMTSSYSFAFEALPDDVFDEIAHSLLGWDLFSLSHASPWLLTTLSREEHWQTRIVTPQEPPENAKKYYVRARSTLFRGQRVDSTEHPTRQGTKVPITDIIQAMSSVTIGLWFSLLPPSDGVFSGGIILGAQSTHHSNVQTWPHYHQQFIHVDMEGNLYCTLTSGDKKPVVANLEFNRWHHLALTYSERMQHVYLDGQLVSVEESYVHHERWDLQYAQVGTGCISGRAVGKPNKKFCGWYGFHGVVYDFRVWESALTAEEIECLFKGAVLETPVSIRATGVECVRASSPLERVFVATKSLECSECPNRELRSIVNPCFPPRGKKSARAPRAEASRKRRIVSALARSQAKRRRQLP